MIFYISKIFWFLFNPFNLIVILILLAFLFNFLNYKLFSKYLYFFSFCIFFISSILPTGSYLYYLLEKDFHTSTKVPNNLDGILILSGASSPFMTNEYNQVSLNGSAERLTEAVRIIQTRPNLKIIFSGGNAHIESPKSNDSDSARMFFENMKIDTNKIIFESKSRNTYENILFSKKVASPKSNEIWMIITSASHLKRALNVADKMQWNLLPYATDFQYKKKFNFYSHKSFFARLSDFQSASHEWIGLIYYYLTNKTDKIL